MARSILLRLWVFCNMVTLSKCITFDIERLASINRDIIPNDFTISNGAWLKTTYQSSCGTNYFNTDNQASNSRCYCKYSHSTFRMGKTPATSSCVPNEDIRTDSGCDIYFENFGHPSNQVAVLPDSGLRVKGNHPFKCKLDGHPQYWDKGQWKTAADILFELSGQTLMWKLKAPKGWYSGRLMRQYMTSCKRIQDSCIVFKAGGTLKYDITMPTRPAATTLSTLNVSTQIPTASTETTNQKESSTLPPISSTTHPTTLETTSTTTLSASSSTSSKKTGANTPVVTEKPITKISERPSNTTVVLPVTVLTEKPSTSTEWTDAGDKGARKGNSDGGGKENTLTIAAIAAVAAIVCVIIICVFVWIVIKRRQKCKDEAYSSGMTVITNSTGTNNTLSGSAVYCEPTDQHSSFPKQLPHLGNPVYAKATIHSNETKNNAPSYKMKKYKDTNHYDNYANHYDNQASVDDDEYACPNVKQANNKLNNDDHDYCYSEPEKPIYEELPDKVVRESLYQPLIRESQIQDNNTGIPEYLTLVNDGQSSNDNNQTIPEYLAIIPDQPISQSPPEYDYAIPKDQRSTTLKRLESKGLQHPVGNGSSSQAPVYDVLEEENRPSNHGNRSIQSPVYDVLEESFPGAENEYLAPVDGIQFK